MNLVASLIILAAAIAVLWLLSYSSKTNQDNCQAEVAKSGNRATCVVVVR